MSLKAYEDACVRAELFGQPLPDKEDFLDQHKHLDVVEFEEVEIKTAEDTAMLDETLQETSGGFAELNTILNSTQTKINRLKGVCGSLTSFFRIKLAPKNDLSYSSQPSYVGQTNYDKDYIAPKSDTEIGSVNQGLGPNDDELTLKSEAAGGDINSALNDLQAMQDSEKTTLISKSAVKDIGKQVTSQVSKLDHMISQADKAQASLSHQNKQMRSFLR